MHKVTEEEKKQKSDTSWGMNLYAELSRRNVKIHILLLDNIYLLHYAKNPAEWLHLGGKM